MHVFLCVTTLDVNMSTKTLLKRNIKVAKSEFEHGIKQMRIEMKAEQLMVAMKYFIGH